MITDDAQLLEELKRRLHDQRSVSDYAVYFAISGISKEKAESLGLLSRAKGRAGFSIANAGCAELFSAHCFGELSDKAAKAIAEAAPGNAAMQAAGIKAVIDGRGVRYAKNLVLAMCGMARERAAGKQKAGAGEESILRQADDAAGTDGVLLRR